MTDQFDMAVPQPTRGRPSVITVRTATGDRAEVKRDQWGRPRLPVHPVTGAPLAARDGGVEKGHTRVTTLAGKLKDSYRIDMRNRRLLAHGIGLRRDLMDLVVALDPIEDKAELQDLAERALEAASANAGAAEGTALHAATKRLDFGQALGNLRDEQRADVEAYRVGMAEHGLSTLVSSTGQLHAERMVIIPELDAAGTFDRVLRSATMWSGTDHRLPRIADLKTGQDVIEWAAMECAIQFALYAHGTAIWNPVTESYEPMPPVDRETGLLLWLPAGKARLEVWEVDLVAGWKMAQTAYGVHLAHKRKDWVKPYAPTTRVQSAPDTVPDVVMPATLLDQISAVSGPLMAARAALSELRASAMRRGEWTGECTIAGRRRLAEIQNGTT